MVREWGRRFKPFILRQARDDQRRDKLGMISTGRMVRDRMISAGVMVREWARFQPRLAG